MQVEVDEGLPSLPTELRRGNSSFLNGVCSNLGRFLRNGFKERTGPERNDERNEINLKRTER